MKPTADSANISGRKKMPQIIERHPNGVVVRRITHDSCVEDNIYCERSYRPQMFGVELVDLTTHTRGMIFRDPFLRNPHLQFDPAQGRRFIVATGNRFKHRIQSKRSEQLLLISHLKFAIQ